MSKYRIVPKQDFGRRGFWIDGAWVKTGFVVTRNGCNCMPGATWFRTVEDAMTGIRVFEETGGGDAFWARMRAAA